jgi:hypothetical protein
MANGNWLLTVGSSLMKKTSHIRNCSRDAARMAALLEPTLNVFNCLLPIAVIDNWLFLPAQDGVGDVFEAQEPAAGVELDGDEVDAPVGVDQIMLGNVGQGELRQSGGFGRGEGFFRQAELGTAAGLYFYEGNGLPIAGDDVDFTVPGAPVAGEDGAAGGREMICGEVFTPTAELLAIIVLCGCVHVIHLPADYFCDSTTNSFKNWTHRRSDENKKQAA